MDELTLNIMMLGGRRAGKTTALAAMQECFNGVFQGTALNLSVNTRSEAFQTLLDKHMELQNYLEKVAEKQVWDENFTADYTPTKGDYTYEYDVRLRGRKVIRLCFYDFDGEWLVPDPAHPERSREDLELVQDKIAESDVLMIVIDTPYLMEENGRYNDVRNRCYEITELVKNNPKKQDELNVPKMVLFVPLKCERWRGESGMREIADRVKNDACYGPLIAYLRQAGNCEMAITPVQTVGTMEFVGFDYYPADDDQGHQAGQTRMSRERDKKEFPGFPLYAFTTPARENHCYKAAPKFCEQLAVYILCHTLYCAKLSAQLREHKRRKRGLLVAFDWLGANTLELFSGLLDGKDRERLRRQIDKLRARYDFTSSAEFLEQEKLLRDKLKRSGDGYQILPPDVLKLNPSNAT